MMRRGLLGVALLASMAGVALAQEAAKLPPFRALDYPILIRQALSYGPDECRRQGGGKVTFAPDTVRKVDLNGDGRDDYIVSFAETECAGFLATYCGTAGCSMEFYVTLPNGKLRNVFSDRIRGYEILTGGKVRFQLHGSYCGGSGNPSCFKEQRIKYTPFAFKEPKE